MNTQKPGRAPVRTAQVEKLFQEHDADIGRKMAACLLEYHKAYVAPMEERLLWLEQPWYRRQLMSAQAAWIVGRMWLRERLNRNKTDSRMREKTDGVES